MDNKEIIKHLLEKRPNMPKRAVVTGGMPYGNKELHFGHTCGMFVYADFFARFLKDRLGKQNVIFVSGTDCYGSPALESYRKLIESKKYSGSIEDFVRQNHNKQKQTLLDYQIGLDFFGASALDDAKEIHIQTSKDMFESLYNNGYLKKFSSLQFFDTDKNVFLNGRQVIGKCPIDNCSSSKAYADECDLGHQYMPTELIDPISVLSGKKPILKNIDNWYFDLDDFVNLLSTWIDSKNVENFRQFVIKEIKEFLKKPEIYIKNEYREMFDKIKDQLGEFTIKEENNKTSFTIVFEKLANREKACELLSDNSIRYRTGKTLVPFRLSGNVSWGLPIPTNIDNNDLTFWVWPESLWAPISFTKTYLKQLGKDEDEWKKWWCNKNCAIYQVIGEDNIYFYGPAQQAMWLATQSNDINKLKIDAPNGNLQLTNLIVNKHSLFLNVKASSSSNIKPPMADDLLKYYTAEQLRAHFLGLSVGNNCASFMPKPLNPNAKQDDIDPVLKEGNLLTNVYNRILRTLFYTWQKDFNCVVPNGIVDTDILDTCMISILKYEKLMMENKFHMVTYELDNFIRNINKYWVKNINDKTTLDEEKQIIINTLHMTKVAMVLLHPLAPLGIENLAKMLKVNDKIFDWDAINEPIYKFVSNPMYYKPEFIESKFDFFKKHNSQLDVE